MNHRFVRLPLLVALVLVAVMLVPMTASAMRKCADTVIKNGFVYTVENHGCSSNVQTAQAVAILKGKIIFVGTDCAAKKYIGPHTEVIDVHGKMVMPGLEDGHFHGQGFVACDMGYSGGTEDQILAKIRDALLRDDQSPLLKTNDVLDCYYFLSSAMLPAGSVLTRDMLDRLSKDPSQDPFGTGTTRPIVVHEADFHKFYANSTAIDNAGITATTVAPEGSFIGHYGADAPAPFLPGDPNGAFSDYTPPQPFGDSAPQPANADYLGKLSDLQKLNQAGVTSGWQALGSPTDLPVWKQLADDGKLTMRINQSMFTPWVRGATDRSFLQSQIDVINAARAQYNGYSSPNSPGTLTVDTAKIFADGVAEFPAQTAAMLEPYNINEGTAEAPVWVPGTLRGPDPTVDDATLGFKMLDKNHWNIHVHAIGNRAVRATLDNFAAIKKANRRWDRREAMVHIEFVDPVDMPRFGKLGVVANFQLQWAGRDVYTVDGVQGYINQDVLNTSYPARSLLKGGAILAQGSDWPVDPYEPFNAIMVAVTRENVANPARGKYGGTNIYSEHISLPQALRMGTMGTAYQLHQEKVTGSIKVGKYADLIVLDQNLFKIPAMQISNTKVLMTMIGGQTVWQDPVNPL
jgi:predicted amidohydrolase YtcJ